jgi:hypothetical protein
MHRDLEMAMDSSSFETEPSSPVVLKHADLPADGDYTIGIVGYHTSQFALERAEQICYAANRLTAPFRGIQTRNTVFQDEEGFYHTLVFPIQQ